MKTLQVLLIIMSVFFYPIINLNASPLYYTFKGTIAEVGDNAGIVAETGLGVGSEVNYKFVVDFEADGTLTYNSWCC